MTGLTTGTTGLLGSPQSLSLGLGLSTPPGLSADPEQDGAVELLGTETQGLALDFTDNTSAVRTT